MRRTNRGRRALLLTAALLVPALAAAPASDAAGSKRCKALAGKKKILVKGPDSMVVSRGNADDYTLTYYGCLYVKPRLVKLPDQNGGDSEFFDQFTLKGKYLAYGHVNVEEAAAHTPGWIELVDLERRRRIFKHDAFPDDAIEEDSGVTQILLRADGALAWIGYLSGARDTYSVQTVLPGQPAPAEVDRGQDIGKRSLRRAVGDSNAFSWVRGGTRMTAAYGGPTVTP
jgi:hypothetical protein